jgi:hypothetical protein
VHGFDQLGQNPPAVGSEHLLDRGDLGGEVIQIVVAQVRQVWAVISRAS